MRDLTKGSVGKEIFLFALPLVLGNVFQQLYSVVDSIIVGRFLGKEALAAVGASFPVIYVLIAMVIGVGSGASVVIAQNYGARKIDRVQRAISTIFVTLFFAAIAITLLGMLFANHIFRWLGIPDEVLEPATQYFKIYLLGQIFFFGFNGVTSVLRGLGDSKTPMFFIIFSTVLNVILDLLFVVVFKWGIEGAAYATVISTAAAFFGTLWKLNRGHEVICFDRRIFLFDKELFRQSMKIGLPTGFQQTFVALGMIALMSIVSQFGTTVLAAYTIVGRIDAIASMPAMNFGSALSSFVGQNIGAKLLNRVKRGFIVTIQMSGIVSILVSLAVILFATPLLRLFTTDVEIIAVGRQYLHIVCSFYLVFSTMFSFHGLFRGAGDSIIPMFVTLASLWLIRVPLAYWLGDAVGVVGIWWSIPLAWLVGLIISWLYYLSGKWKTKAVV